MWFVLYRYIVKSPATILNERFDFLICLFVCLFFIFYVRNSNKREVPKNNPGKHNGIMYFNSSRFLYTNTTPSVKFADSPAYFDISYLNK